MRAIVIILVLLIGGCVYLVSQRPHFSGSSPTSIDVRLSGWSIGTNDYITRITNSSACSGIVREFSRARWVFGSTKVIGTFTFQYENGQTDSVPFLPGFSQGCYSIIRPGGTYEMPTERFRKVLSDGGVDVSKFPND